MMIQEFIDRTGYEPSYEEYQFIEDSYYEFNGNKDEFCKWWLKSKKAGYWNTELILRQTIKKLQDDNEKKINDLEETISWYRKEYEEINEKLHSAMNKGLDIKIKANGEANKFCNATFRLIDNGTIKFYRIEENQFVTCFKVEDVESIEII